MSIKTPESFRPTSPFVEAIHTRVFPMKGYSLRHSFVRMNERRRPETWLRRRWTSVIFVSWHAWLERSIQREFRFQYHFRYTFEIESAKKSSVPFLEGNISPRFRFSPLVSLLNIALGLFFSVTLYQYYSLSKHGWNDKARCIQ